MKTVEVTYRYASDAKFVRERPGDADAAQRRLDKGNRDFAALLNELDSEQGSTQRIIQVDPQDLGLFGSEARAPRQRPYAAVLGCSDARVPIELIFNEGPNDLFVVRLAGNGLGHDALGSLRYAVDHLGDSLKLIVVLGHTGCGALTTAVDLLLDPSAYLALASRHMMRTLLDRLMLVVHACARRMVAQFGPEVVNRPGYRQALVEAAVTTNAALAAYSLQQELANIKNNGVRAVYGVYVLSSREVWAPRFGSRDCAGLASPPDDEREFLEFGDAVMQSDRIAALLD
jgi:carbonic anhydrase